MRRVLVTGGNGQLGHSIRAKLDNYEDIEASFIDVEDLDLTDEEATIRYIGEHPCDVIVNCAAYTAVDRAESEPELAMAVNAFAVKNLAIAAKKSGCKVIHISTDYVFDGNADRPYREDDEPSPTSVYGSTKLEGERLLQEIMEDAIILRTAWLYSEFGRNFFLTMKQKALEGVTVRVVNDQRGTPTYAGFLADTILRIIDSEKWVPGIYHVTDGEETTWYEFTREIYRKFGADPELVKPISSEEYPTPVKRPKYSVLGVEKIKDIYGIER